jgi:hypothetical protein
VSGASKYTLTKISYGMARPCWRLCSAAGDLVVLGAWLAGRVE